MNELQAYIEKLDRANIRETLNTSSYVGKTFQLIIVKKPQQAIFIESPVED